LKSTKPYKYQRHFQLYMIKYLPLLLMLLVSCTPPVVDVDTQTSDDFTVRLEIFYGSSSLPNTEVVIENNTLMVTRKDYEDFSQKLSVEDFERLKRTILDNEFFSLPPEYKKNEFYEEDKIFKLNNTLDFNNVPIIPEGGLIKLKKIK